MPWLKTAENVTIKELFRGNNTKAMKNAGMTRTTYYSRKKNPGAITLKEFGPLSENLSDETIVEIVRAWK